MSWIASTERRALAVILAVLTVIAAPSKSWSLVLACKPGITRKIFARRVYFVPQSQAATLENQLEAWGEQQGLNVGRVGSDDPSAKPPLHSWTSILQSESYGTVLEIRTSSRSGQAVLTVGNNCWAPQEAWRPYWRRLTLQLSAWGYRPKLR